MNELTIFEKGNWKIRAVMINGEPMFAAKDVCDALDLGNSSQAISRLDEDEKGVISNDTLGGIQEMAAVTEPGLYSLVLGSKKPEAKTFKRWITHEVLPAIRKTGGYVNDTEKFVDSYFQTLPSAARLMLVTALDEGKRLNKELQEAKPAIDFYGVVADPGDTKSMDEVAKLIGLQGWGRNRVFAFLRTNGILRENNQPYQPFIDRGMFRLIEQQPWRDRDGVLHVPTKTVVTQKGVEYISKLVRGEFNSRKSLAN